MVELGFEILKAKKVLALQKGFVLIGILLIGDVNKFPVLFLFNSNAPDIRF